MEIRAARPDDWLQIWPFFRDIVTEGETYAYPDDITAEQAQDLWTRDLTASLPSRSRETSQGDARNVVWEREWMARRGVTSWRLDMTHPAVAGPSCRMSMMPMSSWFSGTRGRRGERQRIPIMQAPRRVFCRVPCAALA